MRVANGEPASGKRPSPATKNRSSGSSSAVVFDSSNNINHRDGHLNKNETSGSDHKIVIGATAHQTPLLDAAVSNAESESASRRKRTGSPKNSNSFVEEDARLARTSSTVATARTTTDNSARLLEIPQEHVGHKQNQFHSYHHHSTHESVDNCNDFTTTYGDRSASTQIQKQQQQQQQGVTQHSYNHIIASSGTATTISYPGVYQNAAGTATATNLSRGREEIVEEQFPSVGGSTVQDGLLPPSLPNATPHTSHSNNTDTINQQQRTISPLRERDRRNNMGYTQPAGCFFPNSNTDSVGNNDHSSEDKMEEKTERSFSTTERKDRDDDDTTLSEQQNSSNVASDQLSVAQQQQQQGETTPSTVSTATMTDEASLGGIDSQLQYHNRAPSWEGAPHQLFLPGTEIDHSSGYASQTLPPAFMQPHHGSVWGNPPHQLQLQQRVASFRPEADREHPNNNSRYAFPPMGGGNPSGPVSPRSNHPRDPRWHHQQQSHQQQQKPTGGFPPTPIPPSGQVTPPRAGSSNRSRPGQPLRHAAPPGSGSANQGHSTTVNSRSSSEILKTLLRKKACLYEPDTSRAVALVTWLVGRELVLNHGYFSRQQLQAGVHTCVSEKIKSGAITRTKVNRCMQIILNSCFHYIIPRPDGTEENGDFFRGRFATENQTTLEQKKIKDDSFLLKFLPSPWNDIVIDKDAILAASSVEMANKKTTPTATPQSSPHLGSVPVDKGSPPPPLGHNDGEHGGTENKRAVLLCFNENVRCAEDVFRCHNEFIRDTAHGSNLQLSSHEWQLLFGKEAASAPYLWGNIGIPVPSGAEGQANANHSNDALGMLTAAEAAKFRTSWCAKRYDHDHDLCGFAHVEVNNGWLRRNPLLYNYKDEMCPYVTVSSEKRGYQKGLVINECPHGVNCEYAHSVEEIVYHPRRYKKKACSCLSRSGGCSLGDVCPDFHPVESYRFSNRTDSRSGSRHSRTPHPSSGGKGTVAPPAGAPMLFASPAPRSSFEDNLMLPGLKDLYRRHCAVTRVHIKNSGNFTCWYSSFGDDSGISDANNPADQASE